MDRRLTCAHCLVGNVKIMTVLLPTLVLSGCAGYTSISVNCASVDQSNSSGGVAASCGNITISGNTPTATATTTTTIPAQIGPGSLPGLPSTGHVSGAMIMQPQQQTVQPNIARRVPKFWPQHNLWY